MLSLYLGLNFFPATGLHGSSTPGHLHAEGAIYRPANEYEGGSSESTTRLSVAFA